MRHPPAMVIWRLVYTKQAQKDAKKLSASGLKSQAIQLLEILAEDPFRNPPPYEKLVGIWREPTRGESTSSTEWSIRCSPSSKR